MADYLMTALQMYAPSHSIIRALVRAGGDVSAVDERGSAALHQVWREDTQFELLDFGADIEARDEYGCTPLQHMMGQDEVYLAQALLEAGADVTVRDKKGRTPIRWLVYVRRGRQIWEIRELLTTMLDMGADATVGDEEGKTPLDALRADPDPAGAARAAEQAKMLAAEEAWHRRRQILLAVWERYAAMAEDDGGHLEGPEGEARDDDGDDGGVGGGSADAGSERVVSIVYADGALPPASTA